MTGSRAVGWLAPALVVAATGAVFVPALGNGFVNWDDLQNFVDNPAYRGLGWTQLRWMLTTTHMGPWVPLTWLTLGVDHAIWGMRPLGYHLTSVAFHMATALAVCALARRLLGLACPDASAGSLRAGSAIAALLFAVHPLRVESVAWVTERRDVVSGLFYVSALVAYLKAVAAGTAGSDRRWHRVALVLYLAALLSKSIAVTLPAVLVVFDVYPLRRLGGARGWLRREVWLEKVPYALLAMAVGTLAFLGVLADSYLRPLGGMSAAARVLLSVYGLGFYVWHTAVPLELSPLYQFPVTVTYAQLAATVGGAVAIVALRRRAPALAAAAAAYALALLPVLGLFHNGPQTVADRYSYLPSLGGALLLGGLAARPWAGARVLRAVLAVWIAAMCALTWQQTQVWRDSVTLWMHAVAVNPESRAAHANLARAYTLAGQPAAAIAQWEETRRRSAHQATFLVHIGELHERAGVIPLAVAAYTEALRHTPGLPEACTALRRTAGSGLEMRHLSAIDGARLRAMSYCKT